LTFRTAADMIVYSDVTVTQQFDGARQSRIRLSYADKMHSSTLRCEAAARPALNDRRSPLTVSNSRQLVWFPRRSLAHNERVRTVCGAMSRSTETAVLLEELLRPSHGGPAQMQRLLNFIGWAGPKEKDPSAVRIGVLGASQVRAAATRIGAEPAHQALGTLCSW
jgi:hypothetical protein